MANASQPWSRIEEKKLEKLHASGVKDREIAQILKRTDKAVKSRRKVLGLVDNALRLSQTQKSIISRYYPTHTAHEVSLMIGRSVSAIYQFAKAKNLQKCRRWPTEILDRVVMLNRQGLGEAETAREGNDILDSSRFPPYN